MEKIKEIKKITLRVNQNKKVFYELNGERFDTPQEVLKKVFRDHGELYEKVFGIDRETASIAGWVPEGQFFDRTSYGWSQFLKDRGRICKEVIEEEFTVEEFVHDYVGF